MCRNNNIEYKTSNDRPTAISSKFKAAPTSQPKKKSQKQKKKKMA
jgi:hypothetical protein